MTPTWREAPWCRAWTSAPSAPSPNRLFYRESDFDPGTVAATGTGTAPSDPAVTSLAERHRQHLEHWFHDRDHETHRRLAAACRDDERIGLNFDDVAPGLSRYVHDAIVANADRAAGEER
ncbi:hypothetical protein GCM10022243_55220 [Saccharothrix violaceirubra]|uniref:TipAS antibiotic-recognition domain-containing protein n=1 Tax=Saccharothrix violaceirubra TaxID=413306 RepID=A0A7W7T5M6_9PSEU|nr:TipAS antibiotic-recognition domain-containing protein [Saccharothrix violaceirubra]MBB4967033.1 hypothetical protein [Saccharothrix violaceirubra]